MVSSKKPTDIHLSSAWAYTIVAHVSPYLYRLHRRINRLPLPCDDRTVVLLGRTVFMCPIGGFVLTAMSVCRSDGRFLLAERILEELL